ncbi:glucokinase [Bauldia litoralis]|uniref:glucokinase n=1 Tax=Bauldia litoralis TaxID=665467 RepID=UPI003265C075
MTAPLDRIRFPVLSGDIGGTNARFALTADETAKTERIPTIATTDFATIDDAIEAAVGDRPPGERPKTAILALAGPITGDRVKITNNDWAAEPKTMIARFGMTDVILLNDFEALSLSLPGLGPGDVDAIGGGEARPEGARVVVGPGTGLGTGALIHAGGRWVPIPGEGGHVDLGPVSPRDFEIWPNLEQTFGRMSVETLVCGSGMLRLYRGICATNGVEATLANEADVAARGLAGDDPQAVETLDLFATYLGRYAGDLALIFSAWGGVYLAGGISTRIAPALKSGAFREAFLAKEPHRHLMERIATAIIIKEDAALSGIGDFARAPSRFGVELNGRWWQG